MPQVTGRAFLHPPRALCKRRLVGPVDAAAGPQPCQLPPRQGRGVRGQPAGSRGCAGAAPRPPPQPAVPLTESRDSHNYWDYKERVIDLQPALCDQRPGAPPSPPQPTYPTVSTKPFINVLFH